MTFKAIILIFL